MGETLTAYFSYDILYQRYLELFNTTIPVHVYLCSLGTWAIFKPDKVWCEWINWSDKRDFSKT